VEIPLWPIETRRRVVRVGFLMSRGLGGLGSEEVTELKSLGGFHRWISLLFSLSGDV
jgi:hypothetical protein